MLAEPGTHFVLSTDEHDFTDFLLRVGVGTGSCLRLQVNQVNQ